MVSSPLTLKKARLLPHCERCGHPGSKRVHLTSPCGLCNVSEKGNCSVKPPGFKCECTLCEKVVKSISDLAHLEKLLWNFDYHYTNYSSMNRHVYARRR